MAPKPIVAQRTLYDIRDSNSYTIAKLADGKCWMTENLRLSGGTSGRTLYSSDSNISTASWILPSENTSFPTSCVDTAYNMSSGNTTYGNYYNWYAATAGTGTCSMSSGNASSSICPKGWRLPTGGSGSTSDFRILAYKYDRSTSAMMGSPVNFVLSGFRNGGSTSDQDSRGYYWSSTASYSSDSAYRLLLNSSDVRPQDSIPKPFGLAIRCVAES